MSSAPDALSSAREHPANTPRRILTELLDQTVRGDRTRAWWRGGDGWSVSVGHHAIRDFVSGESFGVWRILTELEGYTDAEARRVLLSRAGIAEGGAAPIPSRRQTPKRVVTPAPTRKAAGALARWQTLAETGPSAYFGRKGVDPQSCAAIRYGRGFAAVLASTITEARTLEPLSVQRIYDTGAKVFAKGGSTKGACALIGAVDLKAALSSGHVWLAEGVATALSVYAATGNPVLAVFTAGNLAPVAKALRLLKPRSALSITVAADSDRYHPVKIGNPGLEAAHKAAMLHGCRIVAPVFADLSTEPTDFNDLHMLEGLAAVRAQLSTPANPDPAQVFAPLARRRERQRRRHGATEGRYLEALELRPGATVLKAPHGTGKTEQLGQHIRTELETGGRVLYVTPSAALTEDAARRLGLESYSDDLHRHHLHAIPGAAICLNSLPRLLDSEGKLTAPELLVLDESEQLVQALTGAHVADRARVLEALVLLLQRSQRVVCLDADAGALTRLLLELARPRERVRSLEHYYPVGQGRTMRLHATRDDLHGELYRCTVPALAVTNSKAEAKALGAALEARGRRVRVLTGERDADSAAFMRDLERNARAERLEVLVCSPTVRTGISLTGGYFGAVFGLFWSTVGSPEDAMQALWRVRTSATYDLWIDPQARREHIDLGAKYTATREHEVALQGRRVGVDSQLYRPIKRAVELSTQKARSGYRWRFLARAALQGFGFEQLEVDPQHRGLASAARDLAERQRKEAIAEQQPRVLAWGAAAESKARELAALRVSSPEDRAALECYRVSTFYRLAPEDDLPAALELDHRGRYRRQLERLELSLAPAEVLTGAIDELLGRLTFADDLPALASRREFYRRVLEAVGFDGVVDMVLEGRAEQLELPRYKAESLQPLHEWIEGARPWLSGTVALPDPEQLRSNLLRYVGSWLKVLGLRQKRTGKNEQAAYALELGTLETACRTMQKRGTLFTLIATQVKSVPTPPPHADDAGAWLLELLKQGRLGDLSGSRLETIRQKLETGASDWLHRLAHSADLRRILGVA